MLASLKRWDNLVASHRYTNFEGDGAQTGSQIAFEERAVFGRPNVFSLILNFDSATACVSYGRNRKAGQRWPIASAPPAFVSCFSGPYGCVC